MFFLMIQSALGMGPLRASAATPAPASTVQPGRSVEYWALAPTRPSDPREVKTLTGTYLSYAFVATPIASMTLTIRDDSGRASQYLLSWNTTLNGQPLRCNPEPTISGHDFCGALPAYLKPGDTRITVTYWVDPFPEFPTYRGTDSIQVENSRG